MAKKKDPSSMKTACIRVSSENMTENGLIKYTLADIEWTIKSWCETMFFEYWFAEHEADEEVSLTHWHIVMKFKNPVEFKAIKKKFPYGLIESARNIKNSVQYLIHLNDKSKKQYEWDIVQTNCNDMTKYKMRSSSQNEYEIEHILEKIDKGQIREYNQFTEIPIELWSRNKTVINNALQYYRERIFMEKNRNIRVVFMSGAPGTGKTVFAKLMCEKMNLTYSISSSSNDIVQDYKGEDVLILDDLRDNDMKFNDLLKLLDNHTRSTTKARFVNKGFIGDMIIITSYRPLSDWYFDESKENKHQLYRRITEQFQFKTDGNVEVFLYDKFKKRYELQQIFKNKFIPQTLKGTSVFNDLISALGTEVDDYIETEVIYEQQTIDKTYGFKKSNEKF